MRTVIVGNRKLARYLFRHVLREGWNVVGAIVPEGKMATNQANFVPFDELATNTDCSIHATEDINRKETRSWLKNIRPDVCLCGGWSQIIGERVLEIPDRGFLGLHSSHLPEGRGGAPVNWSIINGANEVWISLFYYTPGVDAGDVLAQSSVPVEARDDVATVFEALATEACHLVSSVRSDLEVDDVDSESQSHEDATYRPRRQPQDGLIDWNRDPSKQYDWIRAQTDPYPGAYTFNDGEKLTVWRGKAVEGSIGTAEPGEVLAIVEGEGVDVRTGDGRFRLIRVQPNNRPSRWADEYAHEMGLSVGDRLGRTYAPDDWFYTGIWGPEDPTTFDTNLALGESGVVETITFSGSQHDLVIRASLDGEQIFERSLIVTGEHCESVEYRPVDSGTHTVKIRFEINGDHVDTRYLKIFV